MSEFCVGAVRELDATRGVGGVRGKAQTPTRLFFKSPGILCCQSQIDRKTWLACFRRQRRIEYLLQGSYQLADALAAKKEIVIDNFGQAIQFTATHPRGLIIPTSKLKGKYYEQIYTNLRAIAVRCPAVQRIEIGFLRCMRQVPELQSANSGFIYGPHMDPRLKTQIERSILRLVDKIEKILKDYGNKDAAPPKFVSEVQRPIHLFGKP